MKETAHPSAVWARVDAHGRLLSGDGATTSLREDGVGYTVTFDRDVSKCAWLATVESVAGGLGTVPPLLFIAVRLRGEDAEGKRSLYVTIADADGKFAHVPFHVAVLCPGSPPRPPIRIPK